MTSYEMELKISQIEKWQVAAMEIIDGFRKERDKSQDIWSDKDLCRNWQISQRTASTLREKGEIDFLKIGSKVFYTREMREYYINKNSFKNEERN